MNQRFSNAVQELDTLLIWRWLKNPATRAGIRADLIQNALFQLISDKEVGMDTRYRKDAANIIFDECDLDLEYRDQHNKATPLIIAASSGREHFLNILIEKKVNLRAVDEKLERTALSWAARYNAVGCVKILLNALMANHDVKTVQSKDIDGRTALDIARDRRHPEIVKLLELETEVRDGDTEVSLRH